MTQEKNDITIQYLNTLGKTGPVKYYTVYTIRRIQRKNIPIRYHFRVNQILIYVIWPKMVNIRTREESLIQNVNIWWRWSLTLDRVEDRPVPINNNGLRIIPKKLQMETLDMIRLKILLRWKLKEHMDYISDIELVRRTI